MCSESAILSLSNLQRHLWRIKSVLKVSPCCGGFFQQCTVIHSTVIEVCVRLCEREECVFVISL